MLTLRRQVKNLSKADTFIDISLKDDITLTRTLSEAAIRRMDSVLQKDKINWIEYFRK